MYEDGGYSFCPDCGSLMKDGVCVNCGFGGQKEAAENGSSLSDSVPGYSQPGYGSQPGTGYNGANCNEPGYNGVNCNGANYNGPGSNGPNYNASGYNGPGYNASSYNGANYNSPGYNAPNYNGANYNSPGYNATNYNGANYNSPGYNGPGANGHGHEPDRNNGRTVAAILIAVIAVLLCIVMVLAFFLVKNSVQQTMGGIWGQENYHNGSRIPLPYDDYDDEDRIPYEEPEKIVPEEEYVPSADDDYYVEIVDCTRDDLSYQVEWEVYDYEDSETGATAEGRYPQLTGGNIPNIEELNRQIKTEATYYSDLYGYYKDWQEEDSMRYVAESMGYVTYMDEERISVVLREQFIMDSDFYISLYSINIDLVSGEIMDNGKIIEYGEELAKAFRKQNDYQNGTVEAVDDMSDKELQEALSDPTANIVFYTPVGLEIGFNYSSEVSSGWVTATIKDYNRYIKKF